MSSNIPKEPGFYPAIYYNKATNEEKHYLVTIGPKDLENIEKGSIVTFIIDNSGGSRFGKNQLEIMEFGPRIEFPKGGW